ncbi:MAG: (2Fe-2S)-binding protein [Candidatus Izimaplasma sp.]|nr:(2Fe-2S)-binding protein [Candidatus Izimaplasma bacterium]
MENKVICGCHNITLKDIKKHIDSGVKTFEKLQEKTNIGKNCPPCQSSNKLLFMKLLDK